MTTVTKKMVEQGREEKRQQFGEVGLKEECSHFRENNGVPFCVVCGNWINNKERNKKTPFLQCEKNVCYFYARKENCNENQSNA